MKFEEQAEVMATCWSYMFKTGIINRFIKNAYPKIDIDFPTIDQNQENKLIAALKERFLKTIEDNLERFENNEPGLHWDPCSSDIVEGLKTANIIIKGLNKLNGMSRPCIYMNSGGDVSVSNGRGCHFIYYPSYSQEQGFFGGDYFKRLDEIYKEYFNQHTHTTRLKMP